MITLIAAVDDNWGIGYKNRLPWPRIPEDLKRFRDVTTPHMVIMGRKTFVSLGKPLLNRENIVVSRGNFEADGPCSVTDQLEECLTWYKRKESFVIGGAEIYTQSEPFATRILLTRVSGVFPADTFWKPDLNGYTLHSKEDHIQDGQVICSFEDYRRPQPLR